MASTVGGTLCSLISMCRSHRAHLGANQGGDLHSKSNYRRRGVCGSPSDLRCFDNFCTQASFRSVSLLASIHLDILTNSFCSGPHLDTSSYRFERHVLLQAGPSFEGNHGLVYTDVSTWLINSSYPIGRNIYWPDLAQPIIVCTPWW